MCYNGKTATGFVNQLGPIWQLRLSDKADGREFTVIDMFENVVYFNWIVLPRIVSNL